jgi:hypothetical protein
VPPARLRASCDGPQQEAAAPDGRESRPTPCRSGWPDPPRVPRRGCAASPRVLMSKFGPLPIHEAMMWPRPASVNRSASSGNEPLSPPSSSSRAAPIGVTSTSGKPRKSSITSWISRIAVPPNRRPKVDWFVVSLQVYEGVGIDMGQRLTIACDLWDDQRQSVIRDAHSDTMLAPATPDPRGTDRLLHG